MSKKCKAYSASKIGLKPADNRKAFYAGWDAAIREALEQPEREPVAYSYKSRITGAQGFSHHPMPRFIDSESWDIKPLYTSTQQREWKWLTDIDCAGLTSEQVGIVRWAEIKLKEKNT